MKAIRVIVLNLVMLFLASAIPLRAQTYQFEWTDQWDESNPLMAWCLNHPIVGYNTYHVIFHIHPKTGAIDFLKTNVLHYDLTDLTTGKKLVLQDVGQDNYGPSWEWWVGAGVPLPGLNWNEDGRFVMSIFQFHAPGPDGYKVRMQERLHFHINANGDVKVEKDIWKLECNE